MGIVGYTEPQRVAAAVENCDDTDDGHDNIFLPLISKIRIRTRIGRDGGWTGEENCCRALVITG